MTAQTAKTNAGTALKLPPDLNSPDQIGVIMLELNRYIGQLRDLQIRAKTHSKTHQQIAALSELLTLVLQTSNIDAQDIQELEKALSKLEELRHNAPLVRIILAAQPSDDLKNQITDWFRSQIDRNMLITFSARSDIGGGLILQAGSHVYDLSFRKKLIDNKNLIGDLLAKEIAK